MSEQKSKKIPPTTSPFKDNILSNQVALITGGGSGIGLEIARQLGKHGATVVLMGRREKVLATAATALTAEGIKASFITGDVRKAGDPERVCDEVNKQHGHLDILVNCAAGNFLVTAEDLTPKGMQTVLEIDTLGTFAMSRSAFPYLKQSSNAVIINITATLHKPATWYQVHASAAKAAIDSLTRSLSLEWGDYGIRVNGIAPGPIADTAGFTKLSGGADTNELVQFIPAGRVGTKFDIALGCVYLASSAGTWITGETIVIDGGAVHYRPPIADRETIRGFSRKIEAKSRQTGVAQSKL